MSKTTFRKAGVLAATVFALAVPAIQALTDWGLSAQAFSAAGDATLRAASYAFSIWSLIYASLVAYAIYQFRARQAWLSAIAPWAAMAIAGCGLWIIASSANARWATVAIILASAASALMALRRTPKSLASLPERLLAIWPLALLGGWLLVASGLNVLTVLTAEEILRPPSLAAVAVAVAAVTGIALAALRDGISAIYPLPVAWGLIGVFVAEHGRQPAAAYLALGAAALLIAASVVAGLRRRPR